jgi:SEC-C motif-containing protein
MEQCPCGSKIDYLKCCEPVITYKIVASNPERLMRARYSAYVKSEIAFIISSTIEEKRKECDETAIRNWSQKSIWHKLEVLSTSKGGPDDTEGMVEFVAHFTEGGIKKNLHEKGVFKKIDNDWFYVDGEIQRSQPFTRVEEKVSRNDPCPCGSGKKFKKCCATEA